MFIYNFMSNNLIQGKLKQRVCYSYKPIYYNVNDFHLR